MVLNLVLILELGKVPPARSKTASATFRWVCYDFTLLGSERQLLSHFTSVPC